MEPSVKTLRSRVSVEFSEELLNGTTTLRFALLPERANESDKYFFQLDWKTNPQSSRLRQITTASNDVQNI